MNSFNITFLSLRSIAWELLPWCGHISDWRLYSWELTVMVNIIYCSIWGLVLIYHGISHKQSLTERWKFRYLSLMVPRKFCYLSLMVLRKFRNLLLMVQRKFCYFSLMVPRKFRNLPLMVQRKFRYLLLMVPGSSATCRWWCRGSSNTFHWWCQGSSATSRWWCWGSSATCHWWCSGLVVIIVVV